MRSAVIPKTFAHFARLCLTPLLGKPGNPVCTWLSLSELTFARLAQATFQKRAGQSQKSPLFWALPACPLCPPLRGDCRGRAKPRTVPWALPVAGAPGGAADELRSDDVRRLVRPGGTYLARQAVFLAGLNGVVDAHKLASITQPSTPPPPNTTRARPSTAPVRPTSHRRTRGRATALHSRIATNESGDSLDEQNGVVRTHPSRDARSRHTDSIDAFASVRAKRSQTTLRRHAQ
jgi:hypothetical protein